MTRPLAAVGPIVLLAGVVLAADAPPPPARVDALVAQLGSPDFAAREAAGRELERIGPAALPAVAAAADTSADREQARRAARLVARFEKRLADDKALAPTTVDLSADAVPLHAILADLSKQSGYTVTLNGTTEAMNVANKPFTVKPGKASLWDAVAAVCEAADLQIAAVGGVVAPGSAIVAQPVAPQATTQDSALPPPVAPPGVNVKAAVEGAAAELKARKAAVETLERARAEVAKGDGPTAKERAAKLAAARDEAAKQVQVAEEKLKEATKAAGPVAAAPAPPAPVQPPGRIAPAFDAARTPRRPRPTPPAANTANAIVLEPRKGAKRPAANVGAVRLEAVPVPAGAATGDTVVALLQVWAEPRLDWQHAAGVRVATARDARGQALAADLTNDFGGMTAFYGNNVRQVIRQPNGGVIIINNGGRVVINGNVQGNIVVNGGQVVIGNDPHAIEGGVIPTGFVPNARQVVVRLAAGAQPTDALKQLAGTLEAVVRTKPDALVTVPDLSAADDRGHPSGAVRVKTSAVKKNDDGTYTLQVTMRQDTTAVQPAGPEGTPAAGGNVTLPNGIIVRNRGGFMPGGLPFNGLRATDEDGKPYRLEATGFNQLQVLGNGTVQEVQVTARLVPTEKGQPAPKSLAFWGTLAAPVDVPFALADVPASGGKK